MNKTINCLVLLLMLWFVPGIAAALSPGDAAPDFTLTDMNGNTVSLSAAESNPVTILFFFDAASRPSQESLMMLDKISQDYQKAGLTVWGITRSDEAAVKSFVERVKPGFPVLMDSTGVSRAYGAKLILPVVCTLSTNLKVVDYYQGGGKSLEMMVVRLAQRQLSRHQSDLAVALAETVNKKDPSNIQAQSLKGYAALKEGELDKAEQVFQKLEGQKGEAEIAGKEGRAAVLAQKGELDKAMQLVDQIEKMAPDRVYPDVVKGDILAHQGKMEQAGKAYASAVGKTTSEPFQKAEAYNRLGRYQARQGHLQKAISLYDQAVELDPYYLEPTSNKGVVFEKQGRWDQALEEYRKTLVLDAGDTIAGVLARKAEEMVALRKDEQRSRRIDQLVETLAERFRKQQAETPPQDAWTSRPMIVTLVDFEEKGGLADRDGLSTALVAHLGELLSASGRVQVVERVLIERLLDELNLGSSELADPQTALKLGRVLAAKLIATGSLFHLPNSTMLSMRLIDTETTKIPKTYTTDIGSAAISLDRQLYELNRNLLQTIIKTYPLRGYVVQVQEETAMLNLGADQGVVDGSRFAVIEEAPPVVYKGRTLAGKARKVAELEIVSVAPGLSHARIMEKERDIRPDDKVEEISQSKNYE